MTQKEFKVGDFWKDSDGNKHQILEIGDQHLRTYRYATAKNVAIGNFGTAYGFDMSGYNKNMSLHLVEPWKEPETGEFWLNVYLTGERAYLHASKEEADTHAQPNRIACIKVQYTEGEFHE